MKRAALLIGGGAAVRYLALLAARLVVQKRAD